MRRYRLAVSFEDKYTHEYSDKMEISNNREAMLSAFEIYIDNPETTFCNVTIVETGFIIASYMREG